MLSKIFTHIWFSFSLHRMLYKFYFRLPTPYTTKIFFMKKCSDFRMLLASMLTSDFYEEFWVSLASRFHLSLGRKFKRSWGTRRGRNWILRRFSRNVRLISNARHRQANKQCMGNLKSSNMTRNNQRMIENLKMNFFRYCSLLWEKESERIHFYHSEGKLLAQTTMLLHAANFILKLSHFITCTKRYYKNITSSSFLKQRICFFL